MVDVMRRRSRREAAQRTEPLGVAAQRYAAMGWPVCPGAHPNRGLHGTVEPGRACSCDRVGCPAPGAHPATPAWQMQATVDPDTISSWWERWPEANVILVTGRVFDVLDVPAVPGAAAMARLARDNVGTGPVAMLGTDRMQFYVATRGAPEDEDEWWSCGLDSSPENLTSEGSLRWYCRDSYVLAPPSRFPAAQMARWVRSPEGRPLTDALRLLEYLVDACEETP